MAEKDDSRELIAESLRAMDIDEDLAWVLDSLIGFLKSPIWSTSLNNFVDQHSVVFEPDEIEDKDGKIRILPEYESIFDEYRGLVDRLITTHMTELGIDERAFAMACEMADGILAGRLKAVLFEELWAAENYEVFSRWMAKRNVELQLEALNTLAARHGMVYDVFVPYEKDIPDFLAGKNIASQRGDTEGGVDHTPSQTPENKSCQQIEVEADVVDACDSLPADEEVEKEIIVSDKNRLQEMRDRVDSRIQESLLNILQTSPEPERTVESPTPPEKAEQEKKEMKFLTESSDSAQSRAASADIEKRAEYLRAQRDKIIKMRAKERSDHIAKYIKGKTKDEDARSQTNDRPSTAASLGGEAGPELAYRKSLAARLKTEIGGFPNDKK